MTLAAIISLLSLVAMEIALGIDNVIFVAILAGKLPPELRAKARRYWAIIGLIIRVILLSLLTVLIRELQAPIFSIDFDAANYHHQVTGKHIILFIGGLFLLVKAVKEIDDKLEGPADEGDNSTTNVAGKTFWGVMSQIILIDLVFSVDSIVTAIGLAEQLWVMVTAVVIALAGMLAFAKPIGKFVEKHPTFKMLALCFLLLVGIVLVAEGIGQHISKGYIYFAMVFALGVEVLNIRIRHARGNTVRINMPDPDRLTDDSAV